MKGLNRREWVFYHRTAKCEEVVCRLIVTDELSLGLDKDPFIREKWYNTQAKRYDEWRTGLDRHRWSFQPGECSHCEANDILVAAADKGLCVKWCMTTHIPWYPSGHVQPKVEDLVLHLKGCTSHSSSLTLKHMEYLGSILGLSHPLTGAVKSKYTSFNNVKASTKKRSSTPSLLRASDLQTRRLQTFSIPKR